MGWNRLVHSCRRVLIKFIYYITLVRDEPATGTCLVSLEYVFVTRISLLLLQ